MPLTRARTSTSREPAVRPVYSSSSGSAPYATSATVTSCGGGVICAAGSLPHPASAAIAASKVTDSAVLKTGSLFIGYIDPWRAPVRCPCRDGPSGPCCLHLFVESLVDETQ